MPDQGQGDQMLFESYKIVHDQFKVQNEQYFKRVHAVMMVGEIALAGFAANIVRNALPTGVDTNTYALLAGLAQMGIILAGLWFILGCRQMQYMDISRRELRAIEYALRSRIFPLALVEKWICAGDHVRSRSDMWSKLEKSGSGLNLRFGKEGKEECVCFDDIGEEYPTKAKDKGRWEHRPWFAKGRTAGLEVQMSLLFLVGWFFVDAVALMHFGGNEKWWFFGAFGASLAVSVFLLVGLVFWRSYERRIHYVLGSVFAFAVAAMLVRGLEPWRRDVAQHVGPAITLAVGDLDKAISFYGDGIGLQQQPTPQGAALFGVGDHLLALCRRDILQKDAGASAGSARPLSVVLTHQVGSEREVRSVLTRAQGAGAKVVKSPQDRPSGGYHGHFEDPDGHVWEVVWSGKD